MLKIDNLDKLKITSMKPFIIHFKYEDEFYFIYIRNEDGVVTSLYKGRTKFKMEHLKSEYGFIINLIKHKYNKNTLSSIDKRNFVKKLCKAGLIEASDEIEIEVEKEKAEAKQIKEQIILLKQRLRELEFD